MGSTNTESEKPNDLRYYAAYVVTTGADPWKWSQPFEKAGQAQSFGKAKVQEGQAVIAFVVRAIGNDREIINDMTFPLVARKAIERFQELVVKTK
jgi:hypothetical protein